MSRRPRHALSPNLFPFLAVLVCTMGTLILLLALVAQNAKDSAEQVADAQAKQAALDTEEARWRAEELQQLRTRQTAALEKRRSELAHLEDHLRRLREEMAELADEAKAAEQPSESSTARAEARLVSLRAEIDREKARLEEIEQEHDGRPPRVVIVPYTGTNGTDRRPIYVECTDEAVILQPEGVRLTAAHLDGPLGPGNPLDAALRAVRDHWQQTDPESPPPYPLLLIRPDGIHAYAACRVAMTAWDDQFGYELISADMRLAFPEPDAALHDKLVQTIRQAADRQRTKIAAMPRRYDSLTREAIGASDARGGGDAYHRGSTGNGSPNRATSGSGGGLPGGSNGDGDDGGDGDGKSFAGIAPTLDAGDGARGQGSTATRESLASGALRGPRNGATDEGLFAAGGEASEVNEKRATGEMVAGADGSIATSSIANGSLADGAGANGAGANGAKGGEGNGPAGDVATSVSNPLGGSGGSQSRGQLSGSGGSGSSSAPSANGTSISAGGAASPSRADSTMAPQPFDPHAKVFSDEPAPPNFQSDRSSQSDSEPVLSAGNGWAIPESVVGGRGTAIVRQMRMRCERNQFVLYPSSRNSGSMTVIAVREGEVNHAAGELAKALRGRVESWGLAMRNGRWEPVLVVSVAEDAEHRFEQLQALLRGSGIRVERENGP